MLVFCFSLSELPAAAAWSKPARRHKQVRNHGQEGDQQTAQTEGEEERVTERVDEEGISESWTMTQCRRWKEVVEKLSKSPLLPITSHTHNYFSLPHLFTFQNVLIFIFFLFFLNYQPYMQPQNGSPDIVTSLCTTLACPLTHRHTSITHKIRIFLFVS